MESKKYPLQISSIPPPEVIAEYQKIIPEAFERFMSVFEIEQKHRHEIESKITDSNINRSRLGLKFGLTVSLAGFVSVIACAYFGAEVAASIVGGTTIISLASIFVYSYKKKSNEMSQKSELLE